MSKIDRVHTACQGCCFAVYDDGTQTDCELNLLEKYDDVIEAYNQKGEFYIVNGRKCHFKRGQKWADKKTNRIEEVKKECRLSYQSIMIMNSKTNLENISTSLSSIVWQSLPPSHLVVVRPFSSPIQPSKILELVKQTGIKWRVANAERKVSVYNVVTDLISMNYNRYPVYQQMAAGNVITDRKYMERLSNDVFYNNLNIKYIPENSFVVGNSLVHKLLRGKMELCLSPQSE